MDNPLGRSPGVGSNEQPAMPHHDLHASSPGKASGEDSLAILACYSCKRRKVRCNRVLPKCSLCEKIGASCEYPTHAEKPGPKAGTLQRNKRRRPDDGEDSPQLLRHIPERPAEVANMYAHDELRHPRAYNYPHEQKLPSPVTSQRAANAHQPRHSSDPTVAQILYPSHDMHHRQHSPTGSDPCPDMPMRSKKITVQDVCDDLKVSRRCYDYLMAAYFAEMTSYALFKPHSIESKFPFMRTRSEAQALVGSMFAFSARFESGWDFGTRPDDCPPPHYFAHIASSQLDRALNECGDMTPPLWILQACILATHYQLTRSVRSRSWRALGSCIRLGYDMQLHIVDANHQRDLDKNGQPKDIKFWSRQEERRRAWWAIWQLDVYASTIRRLPTAIDWNQNLTFLPVNDSSWFNDEYEPSAYLVTDPGTRWKCLSATGTRSPEAWYIVINSMLRNIQSIVYPPGAILTDQDRDEQRMSSCQADLDILSNCLYSSIVSLPQELMYNGEHLDFRTKLSSRDVNPRTYHAMKYEIHFMIQLCRLMTYHHKISAAAPWVTKEPGEGVSRSEWSKYMNAADEIVNIVRNSAIDAERHVSPHLVNIVWFAASAQVACKLFGPSDFDKRVADSNLSILRLCVERYINFWGTADTLVKKLSKMEQGLRNLIARSCAGSSHDKSHHQASSVSARSSVYTPSMATEGAQQTYHTPATEPSLPYPPINPAMDPSLVPPNPYDFRQPYLYPEMNGWMNTSDLFPYGLEEILGFGPTAQSAM